MPKVELAILGAGVMAEAIARGILRGGTISATNIIAADISPQRRELFQSILGIAATPDAAAAAANAGIVLLCVKPYQIEEVLNSIRAAVDDKTLFISIAAGIGTGFIENILGSGKSWRVIRAMPNTPMLVGEGMVALAAGKNASEADLATGRRIFESGGKVIVLSEEKIDAVTAVSGSGPAYYFYLTEQLMRAGAELGLSDAEARALAIQTAVGAAKMMAQGMDSPADHRRRVTTPNGTTHAAIQHMESNRWPDITVEALKAAARRSREMGK
jgi:pyrroline-5-carboxylate reductase